MKTNKKQIVTILVIFIVGIIIGWLISPSADNTGNTISEEIHQHEDATEWTCSMHPQIRKDKPGKCPICGMELIPVEKKKKTKQAEKTIWTCSMHPQIQQDKPGKCPICGMELIPLEKSKSDNGGMTLDPNAVEMTDEAMKLADIETQKIQKAFPEKQIYLLGNVQPDETKLSTQTAHIPGRIEQLYVNFTGEKISKGQKIARIYSPQLITAQKELFEAVKRKNDYPELYKAARNKLKLWKLNDKQIDEIEANGQVQDELDIYADYSGYVMKRFVEIGDHVKEGGELFLIADISTVWVMTEAYEKDLPWIDLGDEIVFHSESHPGIPFKGKITYINPFINNQKRVAEVRVEIPNQSEKLLPGMYVNSVIHAKTKLNKESIVVPKSAVLWTGKRAIVYVKDTTREHPTFLMREITLGEDAGNYYVVKEGVVEGEEIAVNGVFRIDAAAQLSGKTSMMNPTGGKPATGHNHGGMKMDKKEK